MKQINNYIQEKLVINKDSKLAKHEFVFNPKQKNDSAQEINNVKVHLPFDITIDGNDKSKVSISKIAHNINKQRQFDEWYFYDENDKPVLWITNYGVECLLLKCEKIHTNAYLEDDYKDVQVIENTLVIQK